MVNEFNIYIYIYISYYEIIYIYYDIPKCCSYGNDDFCEIFNNDSKVDHKGKYLTLR